jgi:hypothetical protein
MDTPMRSFTLAIGLKKLELGEDLGLDAMKLRQAAEPNERRIADGLGDRVEDAPASGPPLGARRGRRDRRGRRAGARAERSGFRKLRGHRVLLAVERNVDTLG